MRHQPELTSNEKREMRTKCQNMERKKKLSKLSIGKKGICENFHVTLADTLAKREFAKVKILPACMDGPEELMPIIEHVNDCVCVHEIGGTMTFYRDPTLPRPHGVAVSPQMLEAQEKAVVKELSRTLEHRLEEKARFKEEHRQIQKAMVPDREAFSVVGKAFESADD